MDHRNIEVSPQFIQQQFGAASNLPAMRDDSRLSHYAVKCNKPPTSIRRNQGGCRLDIVNHRTLGAGIAVSKKYSHYTEEKDERAECGNYNFPANAALPQPIKKHGRE